MPENVNHIGNFELLKVYKTAFLCSRKVSAEAVLKCYDWAIEQRENGNCIISGFHSPIEKEVMGILLKGRQPVVLVHARGAFKKIPSLLKTPLNEGRLLILFPFADSINRVTKKTAFIRNKIIINIADEIVVGYQTPGGSLEKILNDADKSVKKLIL